MSNSGVHIDVAGTETADFMAAARRAMTVGGKTVSRTSVAANPLPKIKPQPIVTGQTHAAPIPVDRANAAAGLPRLYALATILFVVVGIVAIWKANVAFAPEMYDESGMVPAAEAFARGENYAVFDLNINIRRLKEEHVARFTDTPDVVVLGASHWQEAHAGLIRSERMYNGHIHRDYWEDLLGVVEVYARNNRLPKRMIISIRDNQFMPVEARRDFLWEPGIPNYRLMADRLGIEKQPAWKTYPYQRMKERLSLAMLFSNVTRWYNANELPHASSEQHFAALDTLLPDGSILWSAQHQAIFTQERARKEALSFAALKKNAPPKVDPKGIAAFDSLLAFLKEKGVQVVLVHPPFNPIYYDAVQGGTYPAGLDRIRQITRDFAAKYDLKIIGEFDPAKVGCTSDMYIDAEHGNPTCLQKIFDQYEAILPELRRTEPKRQS
jgi:hypothetical protein